MNQFNDTGLPREGWSWIRRRAHGSTLLVETEPAHPGEEFRMRGHGRETDTPPRQSWPRGHSGSGWGLAWARPFQQMPGREVWEDQHEHRWVEHSRLR